MIEKFKIILIKYFLLLKFSIFINVFFLYGIARKIRKFFWLGKNKNLFN